MSEPDVQTARERLGGHEAFERAADGFTVTTVPFENRVTVTDGERPRLDYTVRVTVPTLQAATADEVGDAVAAGWLDTLERRLEDAPKATRARVEMTDFGVEQVGDSVTVTYTFTSTIPDQAAGIAKTFVEYVEGTYVEGIVPGYEYEPPVSDLLADASQTGSGGTPL
ncbi:MAG: DUF5813 family protein [Halovenus sp.]